MTLSITQESRQFIESQVSSGRYPSEDAVVEAALRRMREESSPDATTFPEVDSPLWGIFRDEPEMVDEIVRQAMEDRRTIPLRAPADG